MNNIPISKLTETFGHVKLHKYIGDIILNHSTNPEPLGSVVYSNLFYRSEIKVADIGCGYGRCIPHLANIVPKNSEYIGIDPLETNEIPFLNNAKQAGYSGKYICGKANKISDFPDKYFDLILCNYSLYFFIDNLPLIVKKLNPDGLFITITHSNNSLYELLEDLQKVLKIDHRPTWNKLGSEQILDNFNAENGLNLLKPHFDKIEKIKYKNNLEFPEIDIKSLMDLLNFKKTTLIQNNEYVKFIKTKEFDNKLENEILSKIKAIGYYRLKKDDMIFRCRSPKNI